MKQTTKDWLAIAEDDLLAAKTLAGDVRLTSLFPFSLHIPPFSFS